MATKQATLWFRCQTPLRSSPSPLTPFSWEKMGHIPLETENTSRGAARTDATSAFEARDVQNEM